MARKGDAAARVSEARNILRALGLPTPQTNERAALTLLALLDLPPSKPWQEAQQPLIGVTPIMGFVAAHYGVEWAPNTRETVRRQTLHQFVQAGIVVANPDEPRRATNSPYYRYQIVPEVLALLRTATMSGWDYALRSYLANSETLRDRYRQSREMQLIPLKLEGKEIHLTPGGQNELIERIVRDFAPRFTPGARPLYVGDTGTKFAGVKGAKFAHFDAARMKDLGVEIEEHGKMPDVVLHFEAKGWLVLIEAVTSHGPVSPKRMAELKALFAGSRAGLVFVTAFMDRATLNRYLAEVAWETEVWVAESPEHMIHFNGERFLGPYEA